MAVASRSPADSVELLDRIVESSPTAVFVKDVDLRYVLANPALAAQFGKTPEQVIGATDLSLTQRDVAEQLRTNDREVMESGRRTRYEEAIPLDGDMRTYVAVKFPFRDANDEVAGVVGFSTDITDRKRVEEELSENEQRFRAFIQATSDAVYRMGPDWQQMYQLRGRHFIPDTDTPSGSWVEKYIPAEDRPVVLATIREAIRTKSVFELEHRVLRVDGSIGWTFSRAIPILDASGQIVEWFGAARDVTRRKELETQTAKAQERLRRELHRTGVLKEAASVSAVLDAREIARRVLESLRSSLGIRAGVVYVLDEERPILHGLALLGYGREAWHLVEEVPLDEGTMSGLSTLHDDVLALAYDELPAKTRRRAELVGEGDSRWVSLPVHSGGKAIGNITLVFDCDRGLDDDDLSLLRSVAAQLGVAITNARLYEREREASRLGEALGRIDQDIHSSMEVEKIIASALAEGAASIGAQSGTISEVEEHHWVDTYAWGFATSPVGNVYTRKENPHGEMAVRTGETIAIDDAMNDPRVLTETMTALGLRSVIVSPLIVRGRPFGALYYNFHDALHRFTPSEVDFVRKVASSLSLAIENARLFEAERDVADRLQEALLALPEEIPGIRFATAYNSAAEAARVGGDFYDLFEMPQDQVGILIGDVAGKGLNAAVLTSLAKNTIRAHAIEKGATPDRILQLTNEVLYRETAPESFVTVFFGVLDCASGRLIYANAGHTTGALIGTDGVRRLPSTGPILGAIDSLEIEQQVVSLGEDDSLFLYTDGLTEARRDGELYGEERLMTMLAGMKCRSPDGVVRDVIRSVMEFTGNRLSDDLAILTVARDRGGPAD